MSSQLLMIEDDTRLAEMVGEYLGQSGLHVTHRADGKSGLAQLQGPEAGPLPDLVILDLMLPDMDGLEVCRRIRSLQGPAAQVPVLMLTAKGDPMDRIIGLELGADDYLPKPFEPRELLARIRAILRRRTDGGTPAATPALRFGSLEIDRDARTVTVGGQVADLTSYQFDLLVTLAERAGRVLTRDQIMEAVRGRERGADDSLPKPFDPRELLARIRAILRRRTDGGTPAATPALRFGSLEIDRDARTVTVGGQVADLTSYQFDLLVTLAERAGRVLTRDQIMEAVRGRELDAFDRSIDVHMGRIRAAIEADAKNPRRILTVRGVGYVFAKQQD